MLVCSNNQWFLHFAQTHFGSIGTATGTFLPVFEPSGFVKSVKQSAIWTSYSTLLATQQVQRFTKYGGSRAISVKDLQCPVHFLALTVTMQSSFIVTVWGTLLGKHFGSTSLNMSILAIVVSKPSVLACKAHNVSSSPDSTSRCEDSLDGELLKLFLLKEETKTCNELHKRVLQSTTRDPGY